MNENLNLICKYTIAGADVTRETIRKEARNPALRLPRIGQWMVIVPAAPGMLTKVAKLRRPDERGNAQYLIVTGPYGAVDSEFAQYITRLDAYPERPKDRMVR